ncbi:MULTISPECIES: flagellar assembly peptidoglycan hydrolase FlgJ [Methylomonas]|uniref:Peptidoglycan hydrolase FlgJ n=1 Tax=Methylomonas koyamae TaxID=702114 RepID=A0A177PIE1_9GAMM|nr:flagellar assembly peptidoglycan hydrolase FlgJ [Methylomonas koyamae]OAI29150.1 flagellar rod assembly protein/muramidase FlgJ [Methylomonas koyamae]
MLNADTTSVYTDFAGLAKLKQGARESSPAAIKEAAKQFESLFLGMVMKSMREAKLADGFADSQQSKMYQDMYDQQMAMHLSGTGVGLAEVIAKQLSPRQDKQEDEPGRVLQASDYLDRVAGSGSANGNRQPPRGGQAASNALDASGLSSLERSLARLERDQSNTAGRWRDLDAAPASSDVIDDGATPAQQTFFNELMPHARQAAQSLGVDAKLLLAQAALETGWGQAMVKNGGDNSYNLFNIKADRAWQGKQAKAMTLEFDGGVAQKQVAGFRAYDSYKDSFNDYVDFIKSNPRYEQALKNAENPAQYIRSLQKAGYATDPKYAEKVMSIYRSHAGDSAASDTNG